MKSSSESEGSFEGPSTSGVRRGGRRGRRLEPPKITMDGDSDLEDHVPGIRIPLVYKNKWKF